MATRYGLLIDQALYTQNGDWSDVLVSVGQDNKVRMIAVGDDEYSTEVSMTKQDFEELVSYVTVQFRMKEERQP